MSNHDYQLPQMEELNDKKSYEISFIAAAEEDVKRLTESLKGVGAEITFESPLLKIFLAYPIEKKNEAYFGYFHFSFQPEEIVKLEKQFRVQPVVLRFLIVTPPFVKGKERRQYSPRRKTPYIPPVTERKQISRLSNEALEKQLKEIMQ